MGSTARNLFVETKRRRDSVPNYVFKYNANAFALDVNITGPAAEKLKLAYVELPDTGGNVTGTVTASKAALPVIYTGGYTKVSGYQDEEGNYVTVATAVIEGLKILEILSAERVVAQITTTMVPGESVQSVLFSGSAIKGLVISGQAIPVSVNADALGPKPADGSSYFSNVPAGMTVSGQTLTGTILTLAPTMSANFPVAALGNVSLGQLTVTQTPQPDGSSTYDYNVEMIRADLSGGGAQGCVIVAAADPNGTGRG